MAAMSDHELLLRHAMKWAQQRKLPLDREVLEQVLDLRDFHDEQRPQAWPVGSAEHLMLVRWPSHGPSQVPDPDLLVGTLDTFWRFLRGSGRMATGSAEPKALAKEARRAAPQMAAACADPANHSVTKNLTDFGASIGISLEGAESLDEVQERMDQITEAWNDLPMEERLRRSPGKSAHQGSIPGQRATGLAQGLLEGATGVFDGPAGGPPFWPEAPDPDEEALMPRKDRAVVARQLQQSPFLQQVLRLANWVGQGRAVTATGVLRLAEARTAYAELDLHAWEVRHREHWARGAETPRPAARPDPDTILADLRSSADLHSLHRLWEGATIGGLIDVGRTKARQVEVEGRTTDDWLHLGMVLLTGLHLSQPEWSGHRPLLLGALLMLLVHGAVDVEELQDWWWGNPENYLGSSAGRTLEEKDRLHLRPISDDVVRSLLAEFADTGVWRRDGDVLHQTDLGYEFALLLASLDEEELFEEDD